LAGYTPALFSKHIEDRTHHVIVSTVQIDNQATIAINATMDDHFPPDKFMVTINMPEIAGPLHRILPSLFTIQTTQC
jgi:hypothetical protein